MTRDFLIVADGLLPVEELEPYRRLYDDITAGRVNVAAHRHDLGSHVELAAGRQENICQVMLIVLSDVRMMHLP